MNEYSTKNTILGTSTNGPIENSVVNAAVTVVNSVIRAVSGGEVPKESTIKKRR